MKLYKLRRALRENSEFYGSKGTARQWMGLIDATARHIAQEHSAISQYNYPIISFPFPDHGFGVRYAKHVPFVPRVWTDDDEFPAVVPMPEYITIEPERIKYTDGKGRIIRVVFGIADHTLFMWELGGIKDHLWIPTEHTTQ
jgi:hypothetical protein